MAEQGQPLLHQFEIDGAHKFGLADSTDSSRYRDEKPISSVQIVQKHISSLGAFASFAMLAFPRWLLPGKGNHPKLHSTSWLDALRGYAALSVITTHKFAFRDLSIFRLPFFNYILWGVAAVDMFFVISGYVLTQRMLQYIRAQKKEKLADSLAAALFRRWLRLFAPCAAATFVAMIFVHFGIIPGPRIDSITGQITDWVVAFAKFSDPLVPIKGWFTPEGVNIVYIDYLWTIPVEYRGSLVAYFFVAATAKLRSLHRLAIGSFLVVVFFIMQNLHGALFLVGTCLAEVSLIRFPERYETGTLPNKAATEPGSTATTARTKPSIRWCFVYGFTFAFGVFLSGFHGNPRTEHPVYSFLGPLTPAQGKWIQRDFVKNFWPSIAAPMMVWSIDSWEVLQQPLNSRFSQLLGELSFGMYVMQRFAFKLLYDPILVPIVNKYFPSGGSWVFGAFVITVIQLLSVFWLADWFARVDKQIVRATRSLQDALFLNW